MALQFNNDLYTGGNERFDSRPHTQLYMQLMAKEQAKQEAFDEYLRNLNKGINSAGLRNVDRQVFDKKMSDWQNYGMQNRDNIRKRKGGADIEFSNKYQDILNTVAESKTEEDKKKPLVEILLDPAKRERLSEDIIPEIAAHDQPIYTVGKNGEIERNPNRRSIDYTKLSFDPKPFEQDKYFKQFEDVKRNEQPPAVVKDRKNMTQTVTTTSVFDDDAKNVIATRATTDYMQNPSFRKVINGLNKDDYNQVFKSNYGRDIQTPADLAAAYTLKGIQQKVITSKLEDDKEALRKDQQAFDLKKLAIQNANAKELIALRKGLDKNDAALQDVWIDNYIDKISEEANIPGADKISYGDAGGKKIYEPFVPIDPVLSKALEKQKVQPSDLTITADGKYRPIYYKFDKDGKRLPGKDGGYVVDTELSVPITRDQLKLSLGAKSVSPTQRTKEMLHKTPAPLPKGKPREVQQDGHTFIWDESQGEYIYKQ